MQWTVDPSPVRLDRAGKGQDHTPNHAKLGCSVFRFETQTKNIHLFDSGNLQATLNDLSVQFLTTIFIQLGLVTANLSLVDVPKEWHHPCMKHRSKQICVKRRVTEALLQPSSRNI